jgi:hypothetical protein
MSWQSKFSIICGSLKCVARAPVIAIIPATAVFRATAKAIAATNHGERTATATALEIAAAIVTRKTIIPALTTKSALKQTPHGTATALLAPDVWTLTAEMTTAIATAAKHANAEGLLPIYAQGTATAVL